MDSTHLTYNLRTRRRVVCESSDMVVQPCVQTELKYLWNGELKKDAKDMNIVSMYMDVTTFAIHQ